MRRSAVLLALGVAVLVLAAVAWVVLGYVRQTSDPGVAQPWRAVEPAEQPTAPPPSSGERADDDEPRIVRPTLVGTVVASDPRWSRASLVDGLSDAKARVYREGDRLPGGAELVSIHPDRVVIRLDGQREVLYLERHKPRGRTADGEAPLAQRVEGVWRTGPDRYRVDRDALAQHLEGAEALLEQAKISLAFDARLGVEGIRLDLPRPGTLFERIGLMTGDVIHRVGSVVIDAAERVGEIGALLNNAREIEVELSRAGERKTLRYSIE